MTHSTLTTRPCRRCKSPELMPNLSHVGNELLRLYLCNPCHRELVALVREWLREQEPEIVVPLHPEKLPCKT